MAFIDSWYAFVNGETVLTHLQFIFQKRQSVKYD